VIRNRLFASGANRDDMHQFTVVRRLSQAEFDSLVEEYFAENGHYPDS
jgi:hypothetical protein